MREASSIRFQSRRKHPVNPLVSFVCISPFEVESQVLEHSWPREKGAAHTGEKLPVTEMRCGVWGRCVAGLLHQLAVDLVAEGPQVQAGLQHTLDDGNRLPRRLQLLQAVEQFHGLLAHRAVAFPTVVWRDEAEQRNTVKDFCRDMFFFPFPPFSPYPGFLNLTDILKKIYNISISLALSLYHDFQLMIPELTFPREDVA